MIVVFAGAGSSKAVDPAKYPTTVEFFQKIPDDVQKRHFFQNTYEYLRHQGGSQAVIDIEQVMWCLQELGTFARNCQDSNAVVGWFCAAERFGRESGAGDNVTNRMIEASRSAVQRIAELCDRINEVVYDLYADEPEKSGLDSTWLPLLDTLADAHGEAVELFTTNYDVVIESALHHLRQSKPTLRVDDGIIAGTQYRYLDSALHMWKESLALSTGKEKGITFTKLHGSIHWSRLTGGRILIGDPGWKGQHKRHVILYPGFKEKPREEPFKTFHEYLAQAVGQARALLFIGYAFRDPYINDILERRTRPSSKVVIVNPAKPLTQVPYPEAMAVHLESGFDRDSVAEAVQHLKS